jgi:hypothetical protein
MRQAISITLEPTCTVFAVIKAPEKKIIRPSRGAYIRT